MLVSSGAASIVARTNDELVATAFPSQSDAENWFGESWHELGEAGVARQVIGTVTIVGMTFSSACSKIGSGLCLVLFSMMSKAPYTICSATDWFEFSQCSSAGRTACCKARATGKSVSSNLA